MGKSTIRVGRCRKVDNDETNPPTTSDTRVHTVVGFTFRHQVPPHHHRVQAVAADDGNDGEFSSAQTISVTVRLPCGAGGSQSLHAHHASSEKADVLVVPLLAANPHENAPHVAPLALGVEEVVVVRAVSVPGLDDKHGISSAAKHLAVRVEVSPSIRRAYSEGVALILLGRVTGKPERSTHRRGGGGGGGGGGGL